MAERTVAHLMEGSGNATILFDRNFHIHAYTVAAHGILATSTDTSSKTALRMDMGFINHCHIKIGMACTRRKEHLAPPLP